MKIKRTYKSHLHGQEVNITVYEESETRLEFEDELAKDTEILGLLKAKPTDAILNDELELWRLIDEEE